MTACEKNPTYNETTNSANSECNIKIQEFFETEKQHNEIIYLNNNKS